MKIPTQFPRSYRLNVNFVVVCAYPFGLAWQSSILRLGLAPISWLSVPSHFGVTSVSETLGGRGGQTCEARMLWCSPKSRAREVLFQFGSQRIQKCPKKWHNLSRTARVADLSLGRCPSPGGEGWLCRSAMRGFPNLFGTR